MLLNAKYGFYKGCDQYLFKLSLEPLQIFCLHDASGIVNEKCRPASSNITKRSCATCFQLLPYSICSCFVAQTLVISQKVRTRQSFCAHRLQKIRGNIDWGKLDFFFRLGINETKKVKNPWGLLRAVRYLSNIRYAVYIFVIYIRYSLFICGISYSYAVFVIHMRYSLFICAEMGTRYYKGSGATATGLK